MLIRRSELVADIRADARFNAARSESNQAEPESETQAGVIQSQRQVAEAIDDRKI